LVALAVFDDGTGPALYAGGRFTTAGGVVVNNIARWDGSEWSDLSGPGGPGVGGGSVPTAPYVSGLAVFDDGSGPALYAGGDFTIAGGVTVNNIARWEGTEWSGTSGDAGVDGDVRSLAVFDDGSGPALYAGGDFTTAGGVTANHIARWDGSEWSALSGPGGTGVGGGYYDPDVRALTVFDDGTGSALYAGGDFTTAGGVTVNSVARWDGTEWSALSGASGTGASGIVHALAVFDDGSGPALYIGGMFSTAGGLYVNNIASWDGSEWSDLSGLSWPGADGPVFALATSDDGSGPALHVGGQFTTAGGVTVNNIARWDGSEWSDLSGPSGTGADSIVRALAAFDDGSGPALYAGGGFETAGGVTVNNIARWNGSEWSALSGPSGTGVSDWVSALTVFDDGSGPALYAGGWFEIAGGVTVNNIARWNGSEWSDLNGGVHGHVAALATFDHGLGPTLYTNLATWHCSSAIFADGFESGTIAAWSRTVP
jgi:hypothetical protein